MTRFKAARHFNTLATFLVGSTTMMALGGIAGPASRADPLPHPKTVQVKPGGASIFAQPKSSGEVIGEYKSGVILNPTLRVFSNEGQIWLKVGDHWLPAASVRILEGSISPANANPPAESAASPAQSSSESLKSAPLQAPVVKAAKSAEVIANDSEVAINVRAQPNTESDAILAVKSGEPAEVLQQTLGKDTYTWYKLKFSKRDGTEGWMRGDFVKVHSPQTQSQSPTPSMPAKNPGSITAPPGVSITLQKTPALQTATQHQAISGQKVEILKMAKGEDGLAWYNIHFIDNAETQGWVRGDQVRLLVNFTPPRSAKLSTANGQIISFFPEPSETNALPIRGISGQEVLVLKQQKGSNGYAWYSIKVQDKPSVQGWVKGENVRLKL
ncbi:SH3 domain-containing protein [Acaryochloris sp. IP29b_bin.137]|uniref:SH3 domain-containing protein n=1 Tax=Acaryochloris sp. IP29b_bin.137 TaxID=2969217 RepID=UPI002604947D|nr:SH3 domain-containing protein [Acaryochloris sp. IP29b_bin.137]